MTVPDYREVLVRAKTEVRLLWPRTSPLPTEEEVNAVAEMAAAFAIREMLRRPPDEGFDPGKDAGAFASMDGK
jgi:hypothetical protein